MTHVSASVRGGSRTNRYLSGLGSGYLAAGVGMLVGLWLTPFTLRYLSRAEFAIFTLAADVLVWLTLADLGVAAGLRAQAAQLAERGEESRLSRLASTAFFTELAIAAVLVLGGLGLGVVFPGLFRVPEELRADARGVVFLLVVSAAINLALQTFSALLVAHQQIHIDNLIRIVLLSLRAGLTVLFLTLGWRMYAVAGANVAAVTLASAIAVYRCRRSLTGIRITPQLASWAELRSLGSMGLWFTVGGLAGILIESTDRLVAARVVSLESVTTLSLTGRLYLLAYGLISQITNTARPGLGQLFGQGDLQAARRAHVRLTTLSTSIAIAVGLALWVGNAAFVCWWVGDRNYGGFWLDSALAVNLIANCWVLPNRATLAAGLVLRPHALSRIVEGVVNLPLSILLGWRFGLPGVLMGTAVACLLTSFWFLPALTGRLLEIETRQLVRGELRPLAAYGGAALVVTCLIHWHALDARGLLQAAGLMVSVFVACVVLMWFLALDSSLRAQATAGARRFFLAQRGGTE